MSRVVPSQVADLIERLFPPARLSSGPGSQIFGDSATELAAILTMAGQIPDELITLGGSELSDYIMALETLRYQLDRWHHSPEPPTLRQVNGRNAVLVIYDALKRCPDETPSPTSVALAYITDPKLRDSIRLDITAANRDLVNGEWKGATVLAGAATEALLLWAIQEYDKTNSGAVPRAVSKLVAADLLPNLPSFISRVCSSFAPPWGVLRTRLV